MLSNFPLSKGSKNKRMRKIDKNLFLPIENLLHVSPTELTITDKMFFKNKR